MRRDDTPVEAVEGEIHEAKPFRIEGLLTASAKVPQPISRAEHVDA